MGELVARRVLADAGVDVAVAGPLGGIGGQDPADGAGDDVGTARLPCGDQAIEPAVGGELVVVHEDHGLVVLAQVQGMFAREGDAGLGLDGVADGPRSGGGFDDLAGGALGIVVDDDDPGGPGVFAGRSLALQGREQSGQLLGAAVADHRQRDTRCRHGGNPRGYCLPSCRPRSPSRHPEHSTSLSRVPCGQPHH